MTDDGPNPASSAVPRRPGGRPGSAVCGPGGRAAARFDPFAPVDAASLAAFRIAFGLLMAWEVWRYFRHGWIEFSYLAPRFHFAYPGFEWVRPWPGVGMHLHFFALGLLAAAVAAGVMHRAACLLLAAGWAFVLLCDQAEYLNHLYLICLLATLLAFAPADRLWSVAARDPARRADAVPAWSLWMLRGQVAIPYVFGGVAKLNPDWLRGEPMLLWMDRMAHVRAVLPAFGDDRLALAFSYGGLLLDLGVVPLLLWRRTRPWAFAAAVGFHLFNAVMFRIGVFPWLMIAATTLFLEPDWPRRLAGRFAARPASDRAAHAGPFPRRRLVVGLLGLWFAVQTLVPLRHWLYPGRVDWTERGSRFAWRMMLRDKASLLLIAAVEPRTGRAVPVDPRPYLNPQQIERMRDYPDMLGRFARFLGDELRRSGDATTEIRVLDLVALNGRRPQPLLDPAADLGRSAEPTSPPILPLAEPLPADPYLVKPEEWTWDGGPIPIGPRRTTRGE